MYGLLRLLTVVMKVPPLLLHPLLALSPPLLVVGLLLQPRDLSLLSLVCSRSELGGEGHIGTQVWNTMVKTHKFIIIAF